MKVFGSKLFFVLVGRRFYWLCGFVFEIDPPSHFPVCVKFHIQRAVAVHFPVQNPLLVINPVVAGPVVHEPGVIGVYLDIVGRKSKRISLASLADEPQMRRFVGGELDGQRLATI